METKTERILDLHSSVARNTTPTECWCCSVLCVCTPLFTIFFIEKKGRNSAVISCKTKNLNYKLLVSEHYKTIHINKNIFFQETTGNEEQEEKLGETQVLDHIQNQAIISTRHTLSHDWVTRMPLHPWIRFRLYSKAHVFALCTGWARQKFYHPL